MMHNLSRASLVIFVLVLTARPWAQTQTVRVTVERANLRVSATPNDRVITVLAKGVELDVLETVGAWYHVRVRTSGVDGYVSNGSVEFVTNPAPVTQPVPAPAARPVAAPPPAQAPGAPGPGARRPTPRQPSSWSDRGYLSVNGTYQATSNGFTNATTFSQYVEAFTVSETYGGVRPPVLDIAGSVRVWRNLAVGAAVTWLSKDRDGELSANVPHPFYFNAPRNVTGVLSSVPRQEIALHLNASWVVPFGKMTQIAIFGGPSYFQVKEGFVNDITTTSSYPYDTATFVSATAVSPSQSQLGFNAGVDVTRRLSSYIGVGAIVRYSRASVKFPFSSGEEATIQAGGLQVGGGVRLRF